MNEPEKSIAADAIAWAVVIALRPYLKGADSSTTEPSERLMDHAANVAHKVIHERLPVIVYGFGNRLPK